MKKFFKAASILAAVSMLFAFASCQQNPEEEPKSGTAPVFKAETKTVDLSIISVTSITEAKVADEKIATVTAEGTKVTVTSVAKGTTAATVKVAGKKDGKDATGEAALTITVSETGKLEVKGLDSITLIETPESGEENPGENPGEENPGENPGGNEPGENPGEEEPVVPPAEEGTITLDFEALRDDIRAQNLFTDSTKLTENKTYVTSGVTLNFLASSKYAFRYNQTVGLTIKGNVFKITGIEGTYDAVITWAIAGKKSTGERTLSVNGGEAQQNQDTSTAASPTAVDNVYTVTNATGDLTFNASNEVVIKTIVITKK